MTFQASLNDNDSGWRDLIADRATDSHRTQLNVANSQKEGNTMAVTVDGRRRSLSKFKRTESVEFRMIFVAAFAVFLVAATVERLMPFKWRRRNAEAGVQKSILQQAKDAANTCAAYAFMG